MIDSTYKDRKRMAQEQQKDKLHKKMKHIIVCSSFGSMYVLKSVEQREDNILARQLRGNKSSLWGYETNKARDHPLHPRLGNKDYEDLVLRFPNHS